MELFCQPGISSLLLHAASKLLHTTVHMQVDVAWSPGLARLSSRLVLQDKAAGGMSDSLEDTCADDGEKETRQENTGRAVCRLRLPG